MRLATILFYNMDSLVRRDRIGFFCVHGNVRAKSYSSHRFARASKN